MGYFKKDELTKDDVRHEFKDKYRKDCRKDIKEKRPQSFLGKVLHYRDSVSLEHIITCIGFGIGVGALAVGGMWVPAMMTAAYTLAGMAVGPAITAASLFTYATIQVRREASKVMKQHIKDGKLCIDTEHKKRLDEKKKGKIPPKSDTVAAPAEPKKVTDFNVSLLSPDFNGLNPLASPVLPKVDIKKAPAVNTTAACA